MPRNEKRPPLVRSLRALARKLGVEDVAGDEVGRAQVASLAERLARVTGHSRDKKEASKLFKEYELTYSSTSGGSAERKENGAGTAGEVAEQPDVVVLRVRGKSFLLTYNWDFMGKPFPDGTGAVEDAAELWGLWLVWKNQAKAALGYHASSLQS